MKDTYTTHVMCYPNPNILEEDTVYSEEVPPVKAWLNMGNWRVFLFTYNSAGMPMRAIEIDDHDQVFDATYIDDALHLMEYAMRIAISHGHLTQQEAK